MKILVNGETRETYRAHDIATLIDELGLPAPAILVEHNGTALRREEWPERELREGDSVEVIRIVAGG